jgi:putative transposase
MRPLSPDLRERIVAALEAGQNRAHIAARFEVSESSVYRLQRLWKTQGDLAPQKQPGRAPAFNEEDLTLLQRLAAKQSDPTGASLVQAWQENTGKLVGLSTMHRALHRLKMSYKKRAASPKRETRQSATPSSRR